MHRHSSRHLFGYSAEKDDKATASYDPNGLIQRAVAAVKAEVPELCVQTDIALDPYTSHGIDGLVIDGEIVNDENSGLVPHGAHSHAEAGGLGRTVRHDGRASRRTPRRPR